MQNNKTIDGNTALAQKPENITCYNATKEAVDNMDIIDGQLQYFIQF